MAERLLTPSKITAWLDCAHFLTLKHEVEAGTRTVESSPFGEMAQMLLAKGLEHETAVLARYRAEGLSVFEVPERVNGESFQQWVDRVGDVLADGHDAVFQMPFVHERHPGHRRLPPPRRRPRDRHLHLRADRRQARPQGGQARPRAAAVLLRRGDRGQHRSDARVDAYRAGIGSIRGGAGRRRAAVLASPARPAGQAADRQW